ncbi:DNA repair protein complementing XP-C cells homolog [Malaya genurostris]|uniref:DNA repair protein complementing XP-C cells homolog n=1 Tax=Malaya genurostris TaxID=325434 RepID=UPI0026F385AB|nr:DNA repair protein complementing XP-C cells homolog [Malaya genurostris]
MSDNFMTDSDDPGTDFSASEDEWLPEKANPSRKNHRQSLTESESDENVSDCSDDDASENHTKNANRKNKLSSKKTSVPVKTKLTSTERKKLYEKYSSKNAAERKAHNTKGSDSESSGDEHLVEADKLDLNSDFFTSKACPSQAYEAPNFDCNAGMRLTDSSEDEEASEQDETMKRESNKKLIKKINQTSQSFVQFEGLSEFNRKIEQAKASVSNFASKQVDSCDSTDIGNLLAIGEHQHGQSSSKKLTLKNKRKKHDSESDWEEVEEKEEASHQQNLQITLKLDSNKTQKGKCGNEIDMEACIKRIINREKRENQNILHKVNTLMAIGHGNYVNSILNSTKLLSLALTMIPSQKCYPKDRTDLEYFEQIVRFYRTVVDLKDKQVYSRFKKLPSLETSLRLQMLTKAAICERDFVLIFIILLRAVGVQCRLVMSLIVAPRKLPQSELHQSDVAKKEPTSVKGKNKVTATASSTSDKGTKRTNDKETTSVDSTKSSSKRKRSEQVKIPQLDGGDDIPTKKSKSTKDIQTLGSLKKATAKTNSSTSSNDHGSKSSTSQPQEISLFSPRKTRKQRKNEALNPIASKASPTIVARFDYKDKRESKDNKTVHATDVGSTSQIPKSSKSNTKNLISDSKSTESDSKAIAGSKTLTTKMPDAKPKAGHSSNSSVAKASNNSLEKSALHKPSKTATSFKTESPKVVKIEYVDKHLKRRLDRRVLSTDDECANARGEKPKPKTGINLWIEVYAEEEEQWIPVDVTSGKVHCLDHIVKQASAPLVYVLAWNNDGSIKDVTTRYCPNYGTSTKKLRVEQEWLDRALEKFKGKKTARDIEEDRCLNQALLEQPLPTTISEFKNHPLYALKRHLLKFEAIYPPEAPTLGFIREEPVYARECVHTLHSREIWLKQARTVKLFETPYKIVSARPKYDRASGQMLPAQPLELYGYWQTQDYEPPTAEDGIVPRNAYGNVELFKPCMLPKKTVHLQLPALNRICKKLGIDCAQAVTGFDFHGGSSHPVYDGFVVCEEYKDLVVDAWYQEQEQEEKREREKFEKRVYGNWKKLIKGLLIRKKLQNKYNFDNLSG